MTIFDYISSILFTKNKLTAATIDTENEFVPYLVNRWISMYSPSCARLSNEINRYLGTLSKSELYSLCMSVFGRVPNKKINYFKRQKDEEKDSEDLIKKVALARELSSREIKGYFKLLNYNNE